MAGKNTGLALGIISSVVGIFVIIVLLNQPIGGPLPFYILEGLTISGFMLIVGIAIIALYYRSPDVLENLFRRKKK